MGATRVGFIRHGGAPSAVAFGQLLAAALTLASAPIVARAIGPDGRGVTATAIACFVLVPALISFGLPIEMRRRAATGNFGGAIRAARRIVMLLFILSAAIAAVLAITLFADFDILTRALVFGGVLLAPLTVSWAVDVSVLIANRKFLDVMLLRVTQPSIYVAGILALWLAGGELQVWEVLAANVLGNLVTAILGALMVARASHGEPVRMATLARESRPYAGSAAIEALSSQLPQVVALPLLGAYASGIYSVAATVGTAPLALAHSLSASYFSHVAKGGHEDQSVITEATRVAIMLAAGCAALVLVAAPIVPLIFGAEFVGAVPVTCMFAVATFGLVANFILAMNLAARGQGWRMTVAQATSLVVGMILFTALGSQLSALGAAAGLGVGYLCGFVVLLRLGRLPIREIVPRPSDVRVLFVRLFGRGSN